MSIDKLNLIVAALFNGKFCGIVIEKLDPLVINRII